MHGRRGLSPRSMLIESPYEPPPDEQRASTAGLLQAPNRPPGTARRRKRPVTRHVAPQQSPITVRPHTSAFGSDLAPLWGTESALDGPDFEQGEQAEDLAQIMKIPWGSPRVMTPRQVQREARLNAPSVYRAMDRAHTPVRPQLPVHPDADTLEEDTVVPLMLTGWLEDYEREKWEFHSTAVYAELKLAEARQLTARLEKPSGFVVAVACDVLRKLLPMLGTAPDLAELLFEELLQAIYLDPEPRASTQELQHSMSFHRQVKVFTADIDRLQAKREALLREQRTTALNIRKIKFECEIKLRHCADVMQSAAFHAWRAHFERTKATFARVSLLFGHWHNSSTDFVKRILVRWHAWALDERCQRKKIEAVNGTEDADLRASDLANTKIRLQNTQAEEKQLRDRLAELEGNIIERRKQHEQLTSHLASSSSREQIVLTQAQMWADMCSVIIGPSMQRLSQRHALWHLHFQQLRFPHLAIPKDRRAPLLHWVNAWLRHAAHPGSLRSLQEGKDTMAFGVVVDTVAESVSDDGGGGGGGGGGGANDSTGPASRSGTAATLHRSGSSRNATRTSFTGAKKAPPSLDPELLGGALQRASFKGDLPSPSPAAAAPAPTTPPPEPEDLAGGQQRSVDRASAQQLLARSLDLLKSRMGAGRTGAFRPEVAGLATTRELLEGHQGATSALLATVAMSTFPSHMPVVLDPDTATGRAAISASSVPTEMDAVEERWTKVTGGGSAFAAATTATASTTTAAAAAAAAASTGGGGAAAGSKAPRRGGQRRSVTEPDVQLAAPAAAPAAATVVVETVTQRDLEALTGNMEHLVGAVLKRETDLRRDRSAYWEAQATVSADMWMQLAAVGVPLTAEADDSAAAGASEEVLDASSAYVSLRKRRLLDVLKRVANATSAFEEVTQTLWNNGALIKRAFRMFAGDDDLDAAEFWALIKQTGLKCADLTGAQIEEVYLTVLRGDAPEAVERGLEPSEFSELLIRLALVRFPKSASLAVRLQQLIDQHIAPGIGRVELSNLRHSVHDDPDFKAALSKHRTLLRRVFKRYCRADAAASDALKTMNLTEFLAFVKDCKMINTSFGSRDAHRIFVLVNLGDGAATSGGRDNTASELIYSEFCDAVVALTCYKMPDPFLPLAHRLTQFITKVVAGLVSRRGLS